MALTLCCEHLWRQWAFFMEEKDGKILDRRVRSCERCDGKQYDNDPEPQTILGRLVEIP
jgi:hypothetical protein